MSEVRFGFEVPVAPASVLGALTDFSPRRPDLWPDLDPDAYRVEWVEGTRALVREGQRSPRLWALEEYDWSTPGTVTWTVRESNFCAPGSYVSARVEPVPTGGSRVHLTWSRKGTGLKGKAIVMLIRLTKGRPLASSLSKAMAALPSEVGPSS